MCSCAGITGIACPRSAGNSPAPRRTAPPLSPSAEYAEYAKSVAWPAPEGDVPSLIGDRWEIDNETYREFLEVLPPLAVRGNSFYLSEFTCGDITTKYTHEGDRYYCEFARVPAQRERVAQTPWGPAQTTAIIGRGYGAVGRVAGCLAGSDTGRSTRARPRAGWPRGKGPGWPGPPTYVPSARPCRSDWSEPGRGGVPCQKPCGRGTR